MNHFLALYDQNVKMSKSFYLDQLRKQKAKSVVSRKLKSKLKRIAPTTGQFGRNSRNVDDGVEFLPRNNHHYYKDRNYT